MVDFELISLQIDTKQIFHDGVSVEMAQVQNVLQKVIYCYAWLLVT